MNSLVKTLKKSRSHTHMRKIKSSDHLNKTPELSIDEIKILLTCNHGASVYQQLSHQVKKQQILQKNKLFDAHRHFGFSTAQSVQHSARINSARLDVMFESGGKVARKETLIMGKSPKGYVKENKENYQKNGSNNLQKLRVKLKINKK